MSVGSPRPFRSGRVQGFESRWSLLDDARAVLAIHAAGPDGLCLGCATGWGRSEPAPCSAARIFLSVVESLGVQMWDVGSERSERRRCESCGGRGWKFVVSRVAGLWSESLDGLVRRSCVDCDGESVLRRV
jgi:hypothetical protein